ncbi:MAG: hypothetical protein JOZ54_19200, partial [Acidobacteria bacterium]|nr:hypothetical protein [Acidobacteriota bacterium]
EDDRHIATIDPDGVALAAAKALDARTIELQQRVSDLEKENEELKQRLERIEEMLQRERP